MANQPWIASAEKIMILVVVICLLGMITVVGMHLGVIPGCKASRVC
jgi:hypothetical protein